MLGSAVKTGAVEFHSSARRVQSKKSQPDIITNTVVESPPVDSDEIKKIIQQLSDLQI